LSNLCDSMDASIIDEHMVGLNPRWCVGKQRVKKEQLPWLYIHTFCAVANWNEHEVMDADLIWMEGS
jgi:hypothetical protein